ncbi:hypothetical protein JCM18899A_29530 [Nocardioides sp. AN3]
MRLLLDQNLSAKLAPLLTEAGHDVDHIADHGMAAAADPDVLALAVETERILVSADTDFGMLLARTHASAPSFVLVRRVIGRRVPDLAALLIENLPTVAEDLTAGAIVVLGESTIRIKQLPIG